MMASNSDLIARQRVLARLREAGVAAQLLEYAESKGYGRDTAMWEFADMLGLVAEMMQKIPAQIEMEAAKASGAIAGATDRAVKETDRVCKAVLEQDVVAAQQVLVAAIASAADDIASATARRQATQWIIAGVLLAGVLSAVFYWIGANAGEKHGFVTAYTQAADEKAAASWANSADGRLARRLADAGGLIFVAECKGDGWKIEKESDGTPVCFPHRDKNGQVTGWRIGKKG